uniref:Uncharacterized protein n=1 Tax=Parascaris equorum TaxID=6256 RepID=A0A914S3R8_PAREQ
MLWYSSWSSSCRCVRLRLKVKYANRNEPFNIPKVIFKTEQQ